MATAKKQRNVLLDVLKLFATFWVLWTHTTAHLFYDFSMGINNELGGFSYIYQVVGESFFGMKGYSTLAFFTFTTGYWFMNAFKRTQRTGVFGKGKDTTLAFKFWGKQYAAYGPYCLYGTLFGMVVFYCAYPRMFESGIVSVLSSVIMAIPQLLGFFTFYDSNQFAGGITIAELTNNYTDPTYAMVNWGGITWYMSAIILFAVFFYVIFMKNETFGVTAVCLLTFTAFQLAENNPTYFIDLRNMGINYEWLRIWGPACLGIWGWYVVDFLKKNINTPARKRGLTAVAIVLSILMTVWVFSAAGGMMTFEFLMAAFLVIVLTEADYYTTGLNKILSKIPGAQYISSISLGVFLHHLPIAWYLEGLKYGQGTCPDWLANLTIPQAHLYGTILMLVLAIPFIFIDKYILQRYGRWFANFTKCNEPVVIEAPAEQAAK